MQRQGINCFSKKSGGVYIGSCGVLFNGFFHTKEEGKKMH